MKLKVEQTGADWSERERVDAKVEARAFVLNRDTKVVDPEIAPLLSSLFDDNNEWLNLPKPTQELSSAETAKGLKSSMKGLQEMRSSFDGNEQKRIDGLVDEIARFLREKNELIARKAIPS